MTEPYDHLPESLSMVTAVLIECDDCDWTRHYDCHGNPPRLTEEGYVFMGGEIPLACPDCDHDEFLLNGVHVSG